MKVEYRKRFLKELSKIPLKIRGNIEQFVFEETPNAESLSEIGRLEKMKGYSLYYKARFGVYRVGVLATEDRIVFERVLHRKAIYRHFPES